MKGFSLLGCLLLNSNRRGQQRYCLRRASIMARKSTAASGDNDDGSKEMAGIMMILSPAKTLDLSALPSTIEDGDNPVNSVIVESRKCWSIPTCSESQTLEIAKEMKKRSKAQLGKLLGISDKLAGTAFEYWKIFREINDGDNNSSGDTKKPCIYAFSGAAYQGLQITNCTNINTIRYLQQNLRIIDPLYGALRPLDMIQPYRLEMATKKLFKHDEKIKLHEYWSQDVCNQLSEELSSKKPSRSSEKKKILLNLASDEYSAVIDLTKLPSDTQYIKIIFWEQGRTIAVHAKRARGLMVRYVADNQCQTLEEIKGFNLEGYSFVENKSNEDTFVFDRTKQTPPNKKSTTTTPKSKTTTKTNKKKKTTTSEAKSEEKIRATKRSRRSR